MRRLITLIATIVVVVALALTSAAVFASCPGPTTTTTSTTTTTVPLAYDLDCAGGAQHADVFLSDVSGVRIVNCHFDLNTVIQLTNVSDALIDNNTFTADANALHSIQINHNGGANVTITRNTLYGGGQAIGCCFFGMDDGIVIQAADGDKVNGNTLDQYWDCGIETARSITNTQIDGNTVTHARTCGIGGWGSPNVPSSWVSVSVTNNHVDQTGLMFRFFAEDTFSTNTFAGNVASNLTTTGIASQFDASAASDSSGNIVSNNDFDVTRPAPQFWPNVAASWTGSDNLCGTRSQSGGSVPCPG